MRRLRRQPKPLGCFEAGRPLADLMASADPTPAPSYPLATANWAWAAGRSFGVIQVCRFAPLAGAAAAGAAAIEEEEEEQEEEDEEEEEQDDEEQDAQPWTGLGRLPVSVGTVA